MLTFCFSEGLKAFPGMPWKLPPSALRVTYHRAQLPWFYQPVVQAKLIPQSSGFISSSPCGSGLLSMGLCSSSCLCLSPKHSPESARLTPGCWQTHLLLNTQASSAWAGLSTSSQSPVIGWLKDLEGLQMLAVCEVFFFCSFIQC